MAFEPPPGSEPAAAITRRQALRLLAGAFVASAAACSSPTRTDRGSAPPPSPEPSSTATSTTASSTTTTAPPPPPPPPGPIAGFVAFGDSGGGPAQVPVAQAMGRWAADHRVDALVTTGDNVYDFGEPRFFAAQLDDPYRELRAGGRPLWVTLGNHDVVWGHGSAQLRHLGLPALPYARELPGVRFLFLDSSRVDGNQAVWLEQQLESPGPPPVVVFHAPVYSCGPHGPFPPAVTRWAPIIEAHRVPLVLNGHDHLYQRFVSPGDVTYVVTGGGGRALYPHTPGCAPPELAAAAVRHHFTAVEVHPDRFVLTAVAPDDTVLDAAEIALAPLGVGAPA